MTANPMTPRPQPTEPPPDTDPNSTRRTWRRIRQLQLASAMTEDDAYEYARCAIELERLGWTLNEAQTDWQPPTSEADSGR